MFLENISVYWHNIDISGRQLASWSQIQHASQSHEICLQVLKGKKEKRKKARFCIHFSCTIWTFPSLALQETAIKFLFRALSYYTYNDRGWLSRCSLHSNKEQVTDKKQRETDVSTTRECDVAAWLDPGLTGCWFKPWFKPPSLPSPYFQGGGLSV